VSGFITKFGAAVWSTEPGRWESRDTTADARAAEPPLTDTDDPGDDVIVLARTVTHARDGAQQAIEVVETPAGVRSLRTRAAG
jgi:hypothetical protein